MRQVVGVTADLVVEGRHGDAPFRGRVIAIALDDGEPGRPPLAEATWLLVADDSRPTPLWVTQSEISGQRLGR